jgi:hypothetical protein
VSAKSNDKLHPDPDKITVGIRQPWVELILRGIKTIEVRTVNTRQRGRIYLYASKKLSDIPAALKAAKRHGLDTPPLPRGMVVGSVELLNTRPIRKSDAKSACVPAARLDGKYAWELRDPVRFAEPLEVLFLPYGVWFYPWKRRG